MRRCVDGRWCGNLIVVPLTEISVDDVEACHDNSGGCDRASLLYDGSTFSFWSVPDQLVRGEAKPMESPKRQGHPHTTVGRLRSRCVQSSSKEIDTVFRSHLFCHRHSPPMVGVAPGYNGLLPDRHVSNPTAVRYVDSLPMNLFCFS